MQNLTTLGISPKKSSGNRSEIKSTVSFQDKNNKFTVNSNQISTHQPENKDIEPTALNETNNLTDNGNNGIDLNNIPTPMFESTYKTVNQENKQLLLSQ